MPSNRNPIRRNRNTGTKKSGYKKQSTFDIPSQNWQPYCENLKLQEQSQRDVNGITVTFLVEKLKANYTYACSIDEICSVLRYCPPEDLDGLGLVVLRQPKKKEEILSPCWGRLRYAFEYKGKLQPAVIIEAVNIDQDIIHSAGISPFFQKELDQLREEGHEITITKRKIIIKSSLQSAKRTQLYRTVLHEIGHYVHYKSGDGDNKHYYEKETFANAYAKRIRDSIPDIH